MFDIKDIQAPPHTKKRESHLELDIKKQRKKMNNNNNKLSSNKHKVETKTQTLKTCLHFF
jgi:hypothetical protein